MASLRVALKLSLAESGTTSTTNGKEVPVNTVLSDPPIVSRKRKHSFEKDPSQNPVGKKKSKSKGTSSHEDDESSSIVKSTRSNTPTVNNDNDNLSVLENEDSMISAPDFTKNNHLGQEDGHDSTNEDIDEEKFKSQSPNFDVSMRNDTPDSADRKELSQDIVRKIVEDELVGNDHVAESIADGGVKKPIEEVKEDVNTENVEDLDVGKDEEQEIDQQDQDMEQNPQESKKPDRRRKKRTPAILRALELTVPSKDSGENINLDGEEGNNADTEGGDNQPRYQSSRAAAKVAKSKLNVSKVSKQQEQGAIVKATEEVVRGTGRGQYQRRPNNTAEPAAKKVVLEWVQCDKCHKWRSFDKLKVDEDSLPEEWYCSLNTWSEYNSCEIEEESAAAEEESNVLDAIDEEPPQVKNEGDDIDIKESNHAVVNTPAKSSRQTNYRSATKDRSGRKERTNYAEDDAAEREMMDKDDGDDKDSNQPFLSTRRRASGGVASAGNAGNTRVAKTNRNPQPANDGAMITPGIAAGAVVNPVNWVMCNKCKKWRKVPEPIDVDSLPEKWYCYMNSWSVLYSRCSTKEEDDSGVNGVSEGAFIQSSNNKGNRGFNRGANLRNNTTAAVVQPAATNKDGTAIKKTSWVMCDRKGCRKWRKVPAQISVEGLGEKWFCEYNTWDPDYSTCDAAQESDSDDDTNQAAIVRQRYQIQSNSKGTNALSYRRIIFGNDGKIRACFSEKNKMGYGIFSSLYPNRSLENEDPNEPAKRINYWWSSNYEEPAVAAANASGGTGGRVSKKAAEQNDETAVQSAKLPPRKDPCRTLAKVDTFGQQFTLLDTLRRIHGWAPVDRMVCDTQLPTATNPEQSALSEKINYIGHPLQRLKAQRLLAGMPVLRRVQLEMVVVRSCCLSCSSNTSAQKQLEGLRELYAELEQLEQENEDQSEGVKGQGLLATIVKSDGNSDSSTVFAASYRRAETSVASSIAEGSIYFPLDQLQRSILSTQFLNKDMEACRQILAEEIALKSATSNNNYNISACCDKLKVILRRLEENQEVEVSLNANGQMVITMLPSFETLRSRIAAKKEKFNKIFNPCNYGEKWSEGGYPLKLRKFFTK